MLKYALVIAVFAGLLVSANAWALPQSATCRPGSRARSYVPLSAPMCVLYQDPWQDCDEDPWQLTSEKKAPDTFLDPWQDDVDPWQPVFAETASTLQADAAIDPWQPLVSQTAKAPRTAAAPDSFEDPWQPAFADPWQDGADDPWQLP
jgi:hypothetical protein